MFDLTGDHCGQPLAKSPLRPAHHLVNDLGGWLDWLQCLITPGHGRRVPLDADYFAM